MTRSKRAVWVLLIVVVIVAADHATKWAAIQTLHPDRIAESGLKPFSFPSSWKYDLFHLQYATNKGAFLSLGSKLPEALRPWILTGLNGVILAALMLFLFLRSHMPASLVIALSLILSGGVGNILDRIFRENNVVVDFMNVGIGTLRSGVFNIADLAIVGGLGLLLFVEIFGARDKEKAESAKGGKD